MHPGAGRTSIDHPCSPRAKVSTRQDEAAQAACVAVCLLESITGEERDAWAALVSEAGIREETRAQRENMTNADAVMTLG